MGSERPFANYLLYILLLIVGLTLLVPGAIYAHGLMNPQPLLIPGNDADVAIVIAQVSVVPWVTLFFIMLLDGFLLTIFGLIFLLDKSRNTRVVDELKILALFASIMTICILLLFAGSTVFCYIIPVAFRAWGLVLLMVLAIIGRWLQSKGLFSDRVSRYIFIIMVIALILDGVSLIFQVRF